ncbi:MAG: peptidase fungalysin [Nocardioides sp.]|nr:peptidase fungalysin [Nocardioides sp.]
MRTSERVAGRPAAKALQIGLGASGVLDIDGTTGTVRILEKLDGALTGPSSGAAAKIAMRYVTNHHSALGLRKADLDTFHLRRAYLDIAGNHHLSWNQTIDGVQVFSNGLTATVDDQGRLLTVGGSPVSGAAAPAARNPATDRITTADAAIAAARTDLGERSATPGPGDTAEEVLLVTRQRSYRAWQAITMSAQQPAVSVFDAASGQLLYRRSLSADESSEATASTGKAHLYFPGHQPGGSPVGVDFSARGWLSKSAKRLSGNNSHTWSDVNDDNLAQTGEEVAPRTGQQWDYTLKPFALPNVSFCGHPYPCSWNPNKPFSWRTNRAQNATQVFFFVNNFHDHLMAAPIGFTEAAGNFQAKNLTGADGDGDAVRTQTDDGANTADGLPDGNHIDNANMSTPPDGTAPVMQMYLQHQPGTTYPDGDPFSPTNVGDEADTVYHEYTHGLSNRLVVDADGLSSLGEVQAGAMGEAWSDWYAMDYLVNQGLQVDQKKQVDVVMFQYDGAGVALDRTEPMDCARDSKSTLCTGGDTGHGGGYTYADYAKVAGSPEVHADGEIWAQTLWTLRDRIGSAASQSLVTRAMELAPSNPSFLDMRNAILVADTAVFDGANHDKIWRTFAGRGMGYFAGSLGGDDSEPGASRSQPPTGSTNGTISGVVTDADSGLPVAGAPVTLAFQGGGTVANPTARTDAQGHYNIGPVPVGRYAKLVVGGAGYDPARSAVTVTTTGATNDFVVRRNWAASSGGASISSSTGPDYGPACGPPQLIDGSLATGWASTTGDNEGTATNVFVPKEVIIDLGRAIDITSFGVDPTATCGDGGSASTGAFSIQTSPNAITWTTARTGAFDQSDRGRVNLLTPTAGSTGVRYVRFTILGNQTPDFANNCPNGAYSGCSFTDVTEVKVYGAES